MLRSSDTSPVSESREALSNSQQKAAVSRTLGLRWGASPSPAVEPALPWGRGQALQALGRLLALEDCPGLVDVEAVFGLRWARGVAEWRVQEICAPRDRLAAMGRECAGVPLCPPAIPAELGKGYGLIFSNAFPWFLHASPLDTLLGLGAGWQPLSPPVIQMKGDDNMIFDINRMFSTVEPLYHVEAVCSIPSAAEIRV